MALGSSFDPVRLFGCEVLDDSGQLLGRVTAVVHRGDGCDVLVEKRHWLKHRVVRVDMDELMEIDGRQYLHRAGGQRSAGPHDGWVA